MKKVVSFSRRQSVIGYGFASFFLMGLIVFYIVPLLISIVYTLTFPSGSYAGLANYIDVFSSRAFQLAAFNTFKFILTGVPLIICISLGFALILHNSFHGSSFYRSVFLYPLVVPLASIVMVINLFFARNGIINDLISRVGLTGPDWIHSGYAFPLLVFIYVWKNCGYNIVLFLAGLNAIPPELYEVARVEGASTIRTFSRITLPLLVPSFFFVSVISIVNSFKSFREAYMLGGSIPDESIYMLQHFMNNNFQNVNYRRLSVAAILVFLLIFLLVFLLYRFWRKRGIRF